MLWKNAVAGVEVGDYASLTLPNVPLFNLAERSAL
jgi:hypothetical protein